MVATNIRLLQPQDLEVLGDLYFPWSNREETVAKWTGYLDEQQKGVRMACIVEQHGTIVGYGNLLPSSDLLACLLFTTTLSFSIFLKSKGAALP
ncbi:MAG: hypothetical protein WCG14_00110 [Chlamydiia bacterium]